MRSTIKSGLLPTFTLALLLAPSSPTRASESCRALIDEVKKLCTATLDHQPVLLSCAYYLGSASEVLRKGGDEKWTLDDHCESLHGTMNRARERMRSRGETPKSVAESADPRCIDFKKDLADRCLGLFSEEGAADYPPGCLGRFGLFERKNAPECS